MAPQKKRLMDLKKARKISSQHSSRVRFLRNLIPVCAFFVVVSLFAWPYLEKAFYAPPVEEARILMETPTVQNTLIKPKLHGFDSEGRPYRLEAQEARQKTKNKADLKIPHSQMLLEDGTAIKVSSQQGQYDKESQSLDYQKEVHLDTSSGFHLQTDEAHIDLRYKSAKGDQALSGSGPTGTLQSRDGFIVKDKALHLLGPSKLVISKNALSHRGPEKSSHQDQE